MCRQLLYSETCLSCNYGLCIEISSLFMKLSEIHIHAKCSHFVNVQLSDSYGEIHVHCLDTGYSLGFHCINPDTLQYCVKCVVACFYMYTNRFDVLVLDAKVCFGCWLSLGADQA